ncbi:MAG: VWA domain-containing protein [Promethearchaeota archaeon]
MVSKRLYLAVEGSDEIDANSIVISKKNADKIGAKEGDEIIYEDVPGQILGKARLIISNSVSSDAVLVNEELNNKWGEKIQWFGTVEVRLSAGEILEQPKPFTPEIPPEIPKFPPEDLTPPKVEENPDLENILDSLIDKDLTSKPPSPVQLPITKPTPPVTQPVYKPAPPVSQPVYKPAPSITEPVYKPAPPVTQPVYKPAPPVTQPVYKPAPPVTQPVYKPPPPVTQPVYKPPPPVTQPVYKPAPPVTQPEYKPAPSITEPVYKPAPPVTQPIMETPPPITQPEPPPITPSYSSYEAAASYPEAVPEEIFQKVERPPEEDCLRLKIELQYDLGGKILLSPKNYDFFGLDPFNPVPILFEDPVTRSQGSAYAEVADLTDDIVRMEPETYETADIQSLDIILFSSAPREPPIVKVDHLNLKVKITSKGVGSKVTISQRNSLSLEVEEGTIVTFEDELIGAWGAGYIVVDENLPNEIIEIEDEIFEATGIGSHEVVVRRNDKAVIPLQSLELGISPISGEDMWNTITMVRNNQDRMKAWLSQFLIFKGLKLGWREANAAINILSTVPELKGEVLAAPKMTSSLNLKAEGLITFNAILVLDISASMLAPDMPCINVAPAVEGIKAAMDNEVVRNFLAQFREGRNMPRRLGAAFAALLFLAEKVGRGFGEKVSVIRFADGAEVLDFDGPFFDSASGKHGILEQAAIEIVEKIGKYKGLATNMGEAMLKAREVLDIYESIERDKPCMLVLLTDGYPTDEPKFVQVINQFFVGNPNVVTYIVGIGNTNIKLMNDIAVRCGGEFFQPKDMGELLVWYSKRARDLVVKLKGGRKYLNI